MNILKKIDPEKRARRNNLAKERNKLRKQHNIKEMEENQKNLKEKVTGLRTALRYGKITKEEALKQLSALAWIHPSTLKWFKQRKEKI